MINFDDFSDRIMDAIEDIQNKKTDCYILDDDDFITEFKSINNFSKNKFTIKRLIKEKTA